MCSDSHSVYVVYAYLYAIPSGGDLANHIGQVYKDLTHAYPQGYLSTMPSGCYRGEGEWSTLDVAALVNPPQNWESSKKCKVPTGEGYEAEGGPNGTAMAASPLISLPADIRTLDPAWAACNDKWQYALPWDPPRALIPVSALAGPTTSAAGTFAIPSAMPKSATPNQIAAPITTSSRSISAINLIAPSSAGRAQQENPDMSSRYPDSHLPSSRHIDATRTDRGSSVFSHITDASQLVPTLIPQQESTLQEKVTAGGPNVANHPSVLSVHTKPAEYMTIVRYSSGTDPQRSSSGIASLSASVHAEAAAQALDQNIPLTLPALVNAYTPSIDSPEKPTTTIHQGRLSIFPLDRSKHPERPMSFTTSASSQPSTTEVNSPNLGAAENSISTLLADADSTMPASVMPSAAQDMGLLISMALGGDTQPSILASNPTLLTDAFSVMSTSFPIPAAPNWEPSASMAMPDTTLTSTLRPTPMFASPDSLLSTSLIDSSAQAEAEAPGSQVSEEPTKLPNSVNTNTTPQHLADDSKPTPSLTTSNRSGVSITRSLASTVPPLSPSHPIRNATQNLAWTRFGGLAIALLLSVRYFFVL